MTRAGSSLELPSVLGIRAGGGLERQRRGCSGIRGLHDSSGPAAARPDHGGRHSRRASILQDRMRELPYSHADHRSEPGGGAPLRRVPSVLRFSAPRHGIARGRNHAEPSDGPPHAHGASLGVRKETSLLHDGRSATLEQTISAHDGQAKKARDRFLKLSAFERSQLIAFLNSL